MKLAITGPPKTGKTTLAAALRIQPGHALPIYHTDDLIDLGWSAASAAAADWFDQPTHAIFEGVAIPRAIRKWLSAHPEGKPADTLICLTTPHEPLTPGQAAMGQGIETVLSEIVDELARRGVAVRRQ